MKPYVYTHSTNLVLLPLLIFRLRISSFLQGFRRYIPFKPLLVRKNPASTYLALLRSLLLLADDHTISSNPSGLCICTVLYSIHVQYLRLKQIPSTFDST